MELFYRALPAPRASGSAVDRVYLRDVCVASPRAAWISDRHDSVSSSLQLPCVKQYPYAASFDIVTARGE